MPYGGATLIADTSVWSNIRKKAAPQTARQEVREAVLGGQLRSSPLVALELTWGARNAKEAQEKTKATAAVLTGARELRVTQDIVDKALVALGQMVGWSPDPDKAPVVDALIAATAQANGIGVLHYNKDFDRISPLLGGYQSVWVAPRGSIQ
ncbi:MAG TPA: PIN domain-containing protein [Solirubrobacteraceae bacterium]|nr:PIN domain-containing protein [Solirubrobacteraceae bacterium]